MTALALTAVASLAASDVKVSPLTTGMVSVIGEPVRTLDVKVTENESPETAEPVSVTVSAPDVSAPDSGPDAAVSLPSVTRTAQPSLFKPLAWPNAIARSVAISYGSVSDAALIGPKVCKASNGEPRCWALLTAPQLAVPTRPNTSVGTPLI